MRTQMVTIQIVPYNEIHQLSSVGRIRKLLNLAKGSKIIVLQGRLRPAEEAELIQATMEEINKEFKGIELAVIYPEKANTTGFSKFRTDMANLLLGDQSGLTVIGPSHVVKSIKKDPHKIELLTQEGKKKRK